MKPKQTDTNWGGARPGAGRPGMEGQRVTLKLPNDVAEAVKRDRNRYRDVLIAAARGGETAAKTSVGKYYTGRYAR